MPEIREVPRRKALWLEFGALCALIVPATLLQPLVSGFTSGGYDTFRPWVNVQFGVAYLGVAAVIAFILWSSGDAWDTFGLPRLQWKLDPVLALGLTLLVVLLNYLPWRATLLKTAPGLWDLYPRPESPIVGASILFAVLVGVIFEELFFRGYLIPRLEELTGNVWIGVVASAVLFGATHVYQGFLNAFFIFGAGLMFGIAFVARRSIWPLVVAHAANNLLLTYMV